MLDVFGNNNGILSVCLDVQLTSVANGQVFVYFQQFIRTHASLFRLKFLIVCKWKQQKKVEMFADFY